MTTAIVVRTSSGVVGRCDARCHDATSSECACICGGRLHGVGAGSAIEENTRQHFGADSLEEALADFAARNGLDRSELRAELVDVQESLDV